MEKTTYQMRLQQWSKIISECLASGLNKTAWCRQNGISDKQFFYWQKILRREAYTKQLEAAILIAQARYQEFQELYQESSSLKNALEARKYVEKAKGILMKRSGLREEEAMKALQKKSKDSNKKLIVIAKEIIAADRLLDI